MSLKEKKGEIPGESREVKSVATHTKCVNKKGNMYQFHCRNKVIYSSVVYRGELSTEKHC